MFSWCYTEYCCVCKQKKQVAKWVAKQVVNVDKFKTIFSSDEIVKTKLILCFCSVKLHIVMFVKMSQNASRMLINVTIFLLV